MNKIILVIFSLLVSSCHSQDKENNKKKLKIEQPSKKETSVNPKTMQTYTSEKFDIKNYLKNRNETVGSYEYIGSNGANIVESDIDGYSFFKDITQKNSFFTEHKEYYNNGSLKTSWKAFINNGFIQGNKYEYDLKGKLVKVEDWDKPFKFTWEQVKKYIEQDLKLGFLKNEIRVNNFDGQDRGIPIWEINFKGNYKDIFGVYYMKLNGTTGDLLKVEKILGRDGEKQIIFEKK